MKTLEVSKVNIEAQQYGMAKAEYLRSTAYDALASQGKQNIVSSDGFKDEVIVGSEEAYNDKLNQKVCTINVYKDDEKLPRFSYKVSKLSSGSDSNGSVPKGTILPWYGNADSVPNGYAICDGRNGTPDLRGRFLVGVDGSTYKLGSKGGEEKHKLVGAELPSQSVDLKGYLVNGWVSRIADNDTGLLHDDKKWGNPSGQLYFGYGANAVSMAYIVYYSSISSAFSIGNDQPHENRPPYYAVRYIMKIS